VKMSGEEVYRPFSRPFHLMPCACIVLWRRTGEPQ